MFLPLQMFQECIYNTQNSILKQYQHNIAMSKQIGNAYRGGKIIIQKVKSKPIIPILLRLLRHIGIYPHYKV